jgi:hypothetical protein
MEVCETQEATNKQLNDMKNKFDDTEGNLQD